MINFIRRKKNKSVLEKNRREKTFLPYDSIRDVLIIFNTSDLPAIKNVAEALRKDGKKVAAWTTRPKDKSLQITYPPYVRAIDLEKEITWSQTLSKSVIDEFEALKYDTFIDFTTADNILLDYLLASNSGRFCIGIRERRIKAYDFILLKKEEHTVFEIYKQLKFYLKSVMG
ncbi:DUF6913 domain-containing protein [Viscerimonas tarda]